MSFKIVVALLCFSSSVVLAKGSQEQSFIVKQDDKKLSKHSANTLKEMLGESARDLFKQAIALSKQLGQCHVVLDHNKEATALHKALGAWQVEIANVQNHCSEILEKLIENQKPFKKATKQELQAAYTSMQEGMTTMNSLVASIKKHQSSFVGMTEFSSVVASVREHTTQTSDLQKTFNTHTCLKLA